LETSSEPEDVRELKRSIDNMEKERRLLLGVKTN
jgi:hypothetical protein